jgi:microcystin-dependent protein
VTNAGGGRPHENIQPSLCINYIISLYGAYPPR